MVKVMTFLRALIDLPEELPKPHIELITDNPVFSNLVSRIENATEELALTRKKSEQTRALYELAQAKAKLALYDSALEDCNKLIRINPQFADAQSLIGEIKKEQDKKLYMHMQIYGNYVSRLVNQIKEIEKETRLIARAKTDEQRAENYFNRASDKESIRLYDAAISDLDKIIELGLEDAYTHEFKAEIKEQKKDFCGALEDYALAIKFALKNSDFWCAQSFYEKKGSIKIKLNDASGAEKELRQAIKYSNKIINEQDADDETPYEIRAELYKKIGRKDKSEKDYRKIIKIMTKKIEEEEDPDNMSYWHNCRTKAYQEIGEKSLAEQDLKKCKELTEKNRKK